MAERLHRINPIMRDRARQLRGQMSPMEKLLWARLRDRRLDKFRFRRQHPVGPYNVDFYCPSTRLVLEIDGDSHATQEQYDQTRAHWLQENGYRVVRFTNLDVIANLDSVMEAIRLECLKVTSPF